MRDCLQIDGLYFHHFESVHGPEVIEGVCIEEQDLLS